MNKSPWDSGVTVLGHSPIVVQKNDIFRGGRQLNCLADSETEQRYCIFNVGPKKWEHFLVMPLHDHVDEQVKRAPQTVISFLSTSGVFPSSRVRVRLSTKTSQKQASQWAAGSLSSLNRR